MGELITEKRIEELKQLLSTGTDGPWVADIKNRGTINEIWTGRFLTSTGIWYTRPMDRVVQEPDYTHARNAELAAEAVSVLPTMIKEIARLKMDLFKSETRYEAQLRVNKEEIAKCLQS